ncbi:hypothetical protein Dsin_008306 [Dipteronia sinensis]|uniref:Uncharacterized protein n=1 Tax=Dipteronia sinensis TaxID=43782 RepID=A0AAE0ANH1_9ROSI|nr:hypothetical protein Dsin_008306 [Dipteronia sinensis]
MWSRVKVTQTTPPKSVRWACWPSKKRRQPFEILTSSGKGKGNTVTEQPNPEDPKRWAQFRSRRIWSERGINLTVFGSIFAPEIVNTLGWNGYVRTLNMVALDLVKEFNYVMVPYLFLQGVPVMVQGREV